MPTLLPAQMTSRDWIETLSRLAPDLPLGWKLAWIEWESGGNQCAWGSAPKNGFAQEAGIAQVNFDKGNSAHGTTSNKLRMEDPSLPGGPVCTLASQKQLRAMTQAEADEHALTNIAEMRQGIAAARAAVPSWTGPDFYAVAKTWHGYPGLPWCFARANAAGYHTFVAAMNAIPHNPTLAGPFAVYGNLRNYKTTDAAGRVTDHVGIFDGAWAVGNGLDRAGHLMAPPAPMSAPNV